MRGPLLTATARYCHRRCCGTLTRLLLGLVLLLLVRTAVAEERGEGGFERAEFRLRMRAAGQRKKMGLCSNTEIISQNLKILYNFYLKDKSGSGHFTVKALCIVLVRSTYVA